MKVLFVHPAIPGARFSSSIAALSAAVKEAGHQVSLLVLPEESDLEQAAAFIDHDVVAVSYMSCRAELVRRFVSHIPAGVRTIAGGPHPTTFPDEVRPLFDAIVVGEGEAPLLAWLKDPAAEHPGLHGRGRWTAPDVDALPDWDRALFGDCRNHGNRYEAAVGVAFSRGFCPFTCTFCGVDAYRRVHGVAPGKASRLRSVDRVLQELEAAPRVPEGFAAWDEVLPLRRSWLKEFMPAYRQRVGAPLAVQLRVEQVTESIADLLAAGGVDYAVVGLECGDERYRRKFLDKPFTNDQAEQAILRLRERGVAVFASYMIGLPFESAAMLAATLRLAQRIPVDHLSWKYFTPERGTRLFGVLQQHDLLIPEYVDHPFGAEEAMIKLTHCSQEDLNRTQAAFRSMAPRPKATFAEPGPDLVLEYRE